MFIRAWPYPMRPRAAIGGYTEQLCHGGSHPNPISHHLCGPEQSPVEAFVVGAGPQSLSDHPLGLFPLSAPQEMIGSPQGGADDH